MEVFFSFYGIYILRSSLFFYFRLMEKKNFYVIFVLNKCSFLTFARIHNSKNADLYKKKKMIKGVLVQGISKKLC